MGQAAQAAWINGQGGPGERSIFRLRTQIRFEQEFEISSHILHERRTPRAPCASLPASQLLCDDCMSTSKLRSRDGAPLYSWFQDNHSVTIDIYVPHGTLPTQLKLKLAKRRLTLLRVSDGEDNGGAATPANAANRAALHGLPMPERQERCRRRGRAAVRAVIYKAVKAGWLSLFVGDAPGQGLVPGPPQMSHASARGRSSPCARGNRS